MKRNLYTWDYQSDTGRHSAGWNRSAKKHDAYHIATTPTGKRAAR